LPSSLGVLAIIGFFLLYIEVRDAMKKSKPVPMRIDPKRKLKQLALWSPMTW
jgi:hypothetical protein